MADEEKKAAPPAAEVAPEEGGKKKIILMAAIIAVILLLQGVAFFGIITLFTPKSSEEMDVEAEKDRMRKEEANNTRVGDFTPPVTITVNLSGVDADKFLKAGISVEFNSVANPKLMEELAKREQKLKNCAIDILSSSTFADLDDPVDKKKILNEIKVRINEMLPVKDVGAIDGVVFTEFVVQ